MSILMHKAIIFTSCVFTSCVYMYIYDMYVCVYYVQTCVHVRFFPSLVRWSSECNNLKSYTQGEIKCHFGEWSASNGWHHQHHSQCAPNLPPQPQVGEHSSWNLMHPEGVQPSTSSHEPVWHSARSPPRSPQRDQMGSPIIHQWVHKHFY